MHPRLRFLGCCFAVLLAVSAHGGDAVFKIKFSGPVRGLKSQVGDGRYTVSYPAALDAEVTGTRAVLAFLRPLLQPRDPDLAATDAWLHRLKADVDRYRRGPDGWHFADRQFHVDLTGDLSRHFRG